jgi:poly(hydroxyalkanoate) depolymerase family esterase
MSAGPYERSGTDQPPSAAPPQPRLPWDGPFLFRSGAGTRPYFVYTPPGYRPGTSVPLLVMLHGCSQTPRGCSIGTWWNDLADEHNMIVVYPGQTPAVAETTMTGNGTAPTDHPADDCWHDGNRDNCWNWFLPQHQTRDAGEPALIAGITRAVIADRQRWTIDASRIYVAGMSAGGAMAVVLGATYPDLFCAVAAHSAVEYQAAANLLDAVKVLGQGGPDPIGQGQRAFVAMGDRARLIPVFVAHGSEDARVNLINGDQTVRQWLETNRRATAGRFTADFSRPTSDVRFGESVPGGHRYRVRRWTDITGTVVQEYWTVDGLGHAWSGGHWLGSFTDPRGPNISRAMYAFLARHRHSSQNTTARDASEY